MKKIFLETFGCQMNVLDSELVENQLRILGYHFTPSLQDADVILYNTCSVRAKSEQKVWSRLGLLKERKLADPSLVIGVIGCMAERDGASLMKRMPQVDLMCGPSELDQLPQLLDNVLKTGKQQHALAGTGGNSGRRTKTLEHAAEKEDGLELLDLARSFSPTQNKFQAYIRIVRGCNKFCTYCVVPYTRGPEVSRTPQAILEEAKKLTHVGALEITLLGQTVNHYLHESPSLNISTPTGPNKSRTTFAELLSLVHDNIPHLPRLRFITSFPADFGDDILHVMNDSPRICRYLHIPAQSGSNRILKMMNRGYTAESYLELIDRARTIVTTNGGIQFAGDFIVGFPTETDADYEATRNLLQKVRYKNSFIFKYSPRPGTLAIKRHPDNVPESTKRHRNNDLLKLQNKICAELNHALIGQTVEVLCEGPSGWSDNEDSTDSVVAASSTTHVASHPPALSPTLASSRLSPIQENPSHTAGSANPLQSRLAPYTPHAQPTLAKKTDRHGRPFTRPNFHSSPSTLQLTGRTTHDQITVFHGPPHLAGKILKVTIQDTQGLTLFANLADPVASPSLEPALTSP